MPFVVGPSGDAQHAFIGAGGAARPWGSGASTSYSPAYGPIQRRVNPVGRSPGSSFLGHMVKSSSVYQWGDAKTGGRISRYLNSSVHRQGMSWVKDALIPQKGIDVMAGKGLGGKAWRGLMKYGGPAATLYAAYSGFQQGGMMGALGAATQFTVESYALGAGLKAMGMTVGGVVGGVAAGVGVVGGAALAGTAMMGYNPLRLASRAAVHEHYEKRASLEMGGPVEDQFGTAATMRQRSIQAIQGSRINGRSALGNEATLMYRPYFR